VRSTSARPPQAATPKRISFRLAAEALDCTLFYALVPNKSLESMVEEAAKAAVKTELAAALHTMELEAQGVRAGDKREMLAALTADIAKAGGKRLWG